MAETLRDLVVSLSLQTDNFTRNIKSVNKQIAEAESQFKLAASGVEGFERSATGLAAQLSTLERRLSLQKDAVTQYEWALSAANDKLQECFSRQNDYAQRLTDAKTAQQALKEQVAAAAQQVRTYSATLGENDSATIAAKANLDALKTVVSYKRASTSLLQRQLRIGYGRAAAILDAMVHDGYIGEMDGSSRARPILQKAYEDLQEAEEGREL